MFALFVEPVSNSVDCKIITDWVYTKCSSSDEYFIHDLGVYISEAYSSERFQYWIYIKLILRRLQNADEISLRGGAHVADSKDYTIKLLRVTRSLMAIRTNSMDTLHTSCSRKLRICPRWWQNDILLYLPCVQLFDQVFIQWLYLFEIDCMIIDPER